MLRALLIDDDEMDAQLMQAAINMAEANFDLTWVSSGEAAFDALRAAPYQLILLDLRMPGMTGFELLRQLKVHLAHRHLPVLVLTGAASDQDVQRAYDLHASSVLIKPSVFDEFVTLVRAIDAYWGQLARFPKHRPGAPEGAQI